MTVGPRRPPGRGTTRPSSAPQAGRRRLGRKRPPSRDTSALYIQRDPLRLILFLLTVVTVSRVHGFVGLSALRPAALLVLLAAGYAFWNPQALNQVAFFKTWPAKVMVALGVMACISVPFGMSIGGSGSFILGVYAKVVLYAFLLILAIRHVRDLYTFVWAYVVSCGILVILAAVVVGISKTAGVGMYDANDLGLVLLIGLPLALATMQSTDNQLVKWLSAATVAGIGMTMALSMSRGGFLGIIAVGVGLLVLLKSVSIAKRLAFVALAATALIFTAPAGYWQSMQTILEPTEDYNWTSAYGRRQVWQRGIGYMINNPITGIGINNFPRAEGTVSDQAERVQLDPSAPGRIKWSAAHNSFLQAGAEMGIPGLLLFSSLVFGGMIAMIRLRKRLPSWWARGDPQERFMYHLALYLPVSLLAFAVTGFFVSFAYLDPIYILGAFMAGLYAAVDAKLRIAARAGRLRSRGRPGPPQSAEVGGQATRTGRVPRRPRMPVGARLGRVPPRR